MSAAALQVSQELTTIVAARWHPSGARDVLACAFENGQIETIPAASRNRPQPSQSRWRHVQRPRRRQRSPDRQRSYERRHRLAWSGALPGFLAGRLTIGDMAVARIVADEYLRRKLCDVSLDEIAARAGVCRKTAKRALGRMRALGLITIEERPVNGHKSLTNVVKIVSREWLCWLEKRPRAQRATLIGGHLAAPTNTRVRKLGNEEETSRQLSGVGPPNGRGGGGLAEAAA
jgi:hypothetical protein